MTNQTMNAVFSKEHEGIVLNPLGSLAMPWWGGGIGLQINDTHPGVDQPLQKATAHFTLFSDPCKISTKADKSEVHTATGMHGTSMDFRGHFELGFGQPVVCAKYPYDRQCYGVYSTFGPQVVEGRIMLPLNLSNNEGPIFVNAKQYHGIMRRRQSRAKAELKNQMIKRRKPYLHLSRHLHAMRRPRGSGGRFLNTKAMNGNKEKTNKDKAATGQTVQATGSQNSEVVQSDGPANSRSVVTNMFSRGEFNSFSMNSLWSSPQSLPNMMNSGHGVVLPSKWVAADSCCNLKV